MSYETVHFSIRIWRTSRLNFTVNRDFLMVKDLVVLFGWLRSKNSVHYHATSIEGSGKPLPK